jgi:DNA-binding NarL/FixJ family response regulator
MVADDHPLLREGVAALLAGQPDMELVAQAATGKAALEQFIEHPPDVVLLDLKMPEGGGLYAISAILKRSPEARIIVLTTYSSDVQAVRALRAGARAYLLKSAVHKDLIETVRKIHAGQKDMSPAVAAEMASRAGEEALTSREVAVLGLIAEGQQNKQIAAKLSVTEETIKSRVKSILSKLHAKDRAHAAILGVKRGIIDP